MGEVRNTVFGGLYFSGAVGKNPRGESGTERRRVGQMKAGHTMLKFEHRFLI